MGAFRIEIVGVGGHGCDRKAKPGDKLYARCGRFGCPDCMAHDFVQQMRQRGMVTEGSAAFSVEVPSDDPRVVEYLRHKSDHEATKAMETPRIPDLPPYSGPIFKVDGKFWRMIPHLAEFTHWPGQPSAVVDDMLKNERKSGCF